MIRDLGYMRRNLSDLETSLSGQESWAKYFLYPRISKAKRYIPETGEVLTDEEEYSRLQILLQDHVKRCERLESCIEDSILNIQVQETMIEQLDQEIFVTKVKAQNVKERAELFFAIPIRRGIYIQQTLF